MKVFCSDKHSLHAPATYFADGTARPVPECPARVDAILDALRPAHTIHTSDHVRSTPAMRAVHGVHSHDYLHYLSSIHRVFSKEFAAPGQSLDVVPDTFLPPGRTPRRPSKPSAQAGYYCFDMAAPITAGTSEAAFSAVRSAVAGADALLAGDRAAYALCRPPGHHAGPSYCGGFCYLNNAAVAAQHLRNSGLKRVAILDIDYHHGNGTQDIFYARDDVFFVSIHADPNTQYPYFWGYASERGEGPGKGFNANYPLPRGTGEKKWLSTLDSALKRIQKYRPEAIIVSLGADIHEEDTVGDFKISLSGFTRAAEKIGALKIPTLIVQEGGYNLEAIGGCVRVFLGSF